MTTENTIYIKPKGVISILFEMIRLTISETIERHSKATYFYNPAVREIFNSNGERVNYAVTIYKRWGKHIKPMVTIADPKPKSLMKKVHSYINSCVNTI